LIKDLGVADKEANNSEYNNKSTFACGLPLLALKAAIGTSGQHKGQSV